MVIYTHTFEAVFRILVKNIFLTSLLIASCLCSYGWKVFTGNELAALLGWWMLFNWKEAHPEPSDTERVYMLATTVSSKILKAFARIEGFHFEVCEL